MKFAHISDAHLGAWGNQPDMSNMPNIAFEKIIRRCIAEKVDFIVIAGDLFDTSIPSIEAVRFAAQKLRELKEKGIRVYAVPGSHDFSPTGKTMLSVLEDSGLLVNVARGETVDGRLVMRMTYDETGIGLVGMIGRRNALERSYFETMTVEKSTAMRNIFVFHSAITEYKPQHLKDMESLPLSSLPKDFDYYATGHVHVHFEDHNNKVFFPGSVFPTSFPELEKYESGFYIVDDFRPMWIENRICGIKSIKISADGKSASQAQEHAENEVRNADLSNSILLLTFHGTLASGRPSEIDMKNISSMAAAKGAIAVKKSIGKLSSREFNEIRVKQAGGVEEIENALIAEHAGSSKYGESLIRDMMKTLAEEKNEGEQASTYIERIVSNARKAAGL